MNSRELGILGEKRAENYFIDNNYILVDKNYKTRFGEIDIIVKDENFIVFVEVKLRKENSLYSGVFAITQSKIKKISTTAKLFLVDYKTDLQPRFDVVQITTNNDNKIIELEHIKNAF